MSPLRHAISLGLAVSLTITGAVSFGYLLLFADHWRGWMVVAAGFLGVSGAMWLYSDLVERDGQ